MTDKTPIDPITHEDARLNIPTPELAPLMDEDDARPIKAAYARRNPDLDPQLIWRGKDIDQAEITADAPPIYLQEQVHPKAIIEDLRAGGKRNGEGGGADLFVFIETEAGTERVVLPLDGATARHAVSRGEWVLQIARCYGVSAGSVLAANRLANPDYILPGWILTIPDIGRQGPIVGPPCVISYTVATGDTWEMLATRHGTTTAILQRANPGLLAVGRSIWVPRVP